MLEKEVGVVGTATDVEEDVGGLKMWWVGAVAFEAARMRVRSGWHDELEVLKLTFRGRQS